MSGNSARSKSGLKEVLATLCESNGMLGRIAEGQLRHLARERADKPVLSGVKTGVGQKGRSVQKGPDFSGPFLAA
jgi:hypothetical protein